MRALSDTLIVTAGDAGFFPLLDGLLASLAALPGSAGLRIAVLDVGLSGEQVATLGARGIQVKAPGWDIDFPGRDDTPRHMQAVTARPFLPLHFPGHDVYLWLDGDTWVQQPQALADLAATARDYGCALCQEFDRAYSIHYRGPTHPNRQIHRAAYANIFEPGDAERLADMPVINVGVFAMAAAAPHWDAWQVRMTAAAQKTNQFLLEQPSLNGVVYLDGYRAQFLPARYNWMCIFAQPRLDTATGLFTELHPPFQPIGIFHLPGPAKTHVFQIAGTDGAALGETRLTHTEASAFAARHRA